MFQSCKGQGECLICGVPVPPSLPIEPKVVKTDTTGSRLMPDCIISCLWSRGLRFADGHFPVNFKHNIELYNSKDDLISIVLRLTNSFIWITQSSLDLNTKASINANKYSSNLAFFLSISDGCVVCNHLYNNSVTSHEGYGSEPYDRGETYTICRTIPVATIGIEMIFESLQIGDKQTDSTDDCFGTAAQTDIDQITVKNGNENIFQCGGVGFTRPFHIKRDINSPDNHLSFKLASSEKSHESYDGFNISYTCE